jgi:hypothetical protein
MGGKAVGIVEYRNARRRVRRRGRIRTCINHGGKCHREERSKDFGGDHFEPEEVSREQI